MKEDYKQGYREGFQDGVEAERRRQEADKNKNHISYCSRCGIPGPILYCSRTPCPNIKTSSHMIAFYGYKYLWY